MTEEELYGSPKEQGWRVPILVKHIIKLELELKEAYAQAYEEAAKVVESKRRSVGTIGEHFDVCWNEACNQGATAIRALKP